MHLQYEQHRWDEWDPTEEELFISDFRNNDTPRKRKQDKDYLFPTQELFQTWLSSYTSLNKQTIEQTISQYHQMNRQLWRFPFDIDIDDLNFDEKGTEIAKALSDNVLLFKNYTKQKD